MVGLAPFNADSGGYQGQRHIRGGRHIVRRALYMACVAAQKANPRINAFCDQLRARGKKTKVAFVAGMRKLLTQLNAMQARSFAHSTLTFTTVAFLARQHHFLARRMQAKPRLAFEKLIVLMALSDQVLSSKPDICSISRTRSD
ncbi:transposase [Paraburkholderia sp. CNPSo 3272]|nr:transposase [Paraburkholderia sp. CNPSo 3272]